MILMNKLWFHRFIMTRLRLFVNEEKLMLIVALSEQGDLRELGGEN